jgi:hypothetical protein
MGRRQDVGRLSKSPAISVNQHVPVLLGMRRRGAPWAARLVVSPK